MVVIVWVMICPLWVTTCTFVTSVGVCDEVLGWTAALGDEAEFEAVV